MELAVVTARRHRTRRAMGLPGRSRTIAVKHLRGEVTRGGVLNKPIAARPQTREDCRDASRPCPFVGCKHHLYLDVNPETGSLKLNFPSIQPEDLVESCSLDLAERGGLTLEEIGLVTNLTRERVRQIEVIGLHSMRAAGVDFKVLDETSPAGFAHPQSNEPNQE